MEIFEALWKNRRIIRTVIIGILVALLFVIIVPADDEVVKDEGTYKENDKSNAPYVASATVEEAITGGVEGSKQIKTAPSTDGGYKIDIDLDQVTDDIIETLDKNGGNLDTYMTGESKKELLKKMIKAELITQYPDLRSADKIGTAVSDPKEVQGAIKFIRHKSDNTEQTLEYIPLGTDADTGTGTLYGLINSGSSNSLNYFSLNEKGNLVVAIYNETVTKTASGSYDTEYKTSEEVVDYLSTDKTYLDSATPQKTYVYETKELQYQSAVSGFAVPFEYLWAFLVCGKDEQFVSDLVDLVLDTSIEVSLYDSLNISETATIEVYNENHWKRQKVDTKSITITSTYDSRTQSYTETKTENTTEGDWGEPIINSKHYYEIIYNKYYYNSISVLAVTKADVWYMTQTVSYTYEKTDPTNPGLSQWETTRRVDDDEEFDSPDNLTTTDTGWITTYNYTYGQTTYKTQKKTYTQEQTKTNQYATYSANNMENYKYTQNGDPVVDEKKLDKTLKEGDECYPNFCTLYLDSESARNNITDYGGVGVTRFFLLLQNNESTVNMVDLTKYILYKATDMDFGVTTFDLTIFNPVDFTKAGGSASQMMVNYIHFWENGSGAPTNADGTKYIVHDDGAGHPTVGYGVDIYNSGYAQVFISAGYSTEIGAEIDVEFVDAIEREIISGSVSSIEARLQGLNLTAYQKTALVSRAYNCGIAGAVDTVRDGKNFKQAYEAYWKEEDDLFDEKVSTANFNHQLYTTYMSKPTTSGGEYLYGLERRRKSEWVLFQTGYYGYETNIDKWHSGADAIVQAAYDVASHFMDTGVVVHYAGNDVTEATNNGRHCIYGDIEGSYTIPLENPSRYGVVCATFVSLSLWQADVCTVEQINQYGYNACSGVSSMLSNARWQRITNYAELQPGDVWFESGHVAIYVGDGKYIDQAYCVVTSGGSDCRGNLRNASAGKFLYALRCTN